MVTGRHERAKRRQLPTLRTFGRNRLKWVLAILAAIGLSAPVQARAQKPSRDEVEAAYLYNFGKFARWPGGLDQGPIVVCVQAQEAFGQTVAKLVQGEQINGRRVEERRLDRPEAADGCSILFVGTGEQGHDADFLAAAEGKPILTVGDGPEFLAHGGMIQFVPVGDHVRFSVNLEACNRHRMALSSELLKVAVSVTGNSNTGGVK